MGVSEKITNAKETTWVTEGIPEEEVAAIVKSARKSIESVKKGESHMTEQEMRKRMKEIDRERNALRDEKDRYERYFYEKEKKAEIESHKNFIDKCFISRGSSKNTNNTIKAFKIIDVLDNSNERYALCVALIDGNRATCWNEYGIQIMMLPLWELNVPRLAVKPTDPKMIDYYEEVDSDTFETLYNEYKQKLDDNIFVK